MKKLLLLAVVLTATIMWGIFNFMQTGFDGFFVNQELLAEKKNIVVMGADSRKKDNDPGRSDTLFVVMVDTNKARGSILSIPRDTRVKIKNKGFDKINHAYAFGGAKLTRDTVQDFLGLKVNNYIVIDFSGFEAIVDSMGGVTVDVEKRMYYKDDWDGFVVDLQPGVQELNGAKAMQYIRYRDEQGDIGRIQRQQKFILAVYNKIHSAEILLKVPGMTKQLASMLNTNMNLKEMVEYGTAMYSFMQEGTLEMEMVPGKPEYINQISYWIPDVEATRKLVEKMQGVLNNKAFEKQSNSLADEYKRSLE